MDFFNGLGKKISQTGQSAVQKTKDMADVAKINSMISDEEKRINETYFNIGKLYVSMHSDDYEEAFQGMISSIKEADKRIADYKRQIQDIKGIKRCPNCNSEIALNAAFCNICGQKVDIPQPVQKEGKVCVSCGQNIEEDSDFCPMCGAKQS